jgi:FtsH-binding integral membrane protein
MVRDWMTEAAHIARELRDVLRRTGRDELRVRAHPRDMLEMQQFMSRMARRLLLGLFASVGAIVAALAYTVHRNPYILALSLVAALLFFLVIFLLPLHLFANPFRGYRRWR